MRKLYDKLLVWLEYALVVIFALMVVDVLWQVFSRFVIGQSSSFKRKKAIAWFMFFFALIVMVIGGGNLVYTTLRLGQVSPAIGVPLGVVYAVVPISGLLVCFFTGMQTQGHGSTQTGLSHNPSA